MYLKVLLVFHSAFLLRFENFLHTSFLTVRVGEKYFLLFLCCLDKIFTKLCKSLSFSRQVIMRSYSRDKVEGILELISLQLLSEYHLNTLNIC